MAKADLRVIGPAANFRRYLVAGGTAIEPGEPTHNLGSLSSGVSSTNTFVLAAADTPVIGTHRFGGVAIEDADLGTGTTVVEQFLNTANPVPNVGRIEGAAETAGNVDTLTELALLLGDVVLIDYSAAGASDGGELYTIKDAATADTSALELVGGNTALSTLQVVIDPRGYRHDVS